MKRNKREFLYLFFNIETHVYFFS